MRLGDRGILQNPITAAMGAMDWNIELKCDSRVSVRNSVSTYPGCSPAFKMQSITGIVAEKYRKEESTKILGNGIEKK